MAVPSSGALSMLKIKNEFANNNYNAGNSYSNISLEDLSDGTAGTINTQNASSDRPDGSAPHSMSEFYAYDHDLSPSLTEYTGGSVESTGLGACSVEEPEENYYHDGSGDDPSIGDTVYEDSSGSSALPAGHHLFVNSSEARVAIQTNSSGVIIGITTCR